jgi:hypothetical protein
MTMTEAKNDRQPLQWNAATKDIKLLEEISCIREKNRGVLLKKMIRERAVHV